MRLLVTGLCFAALAGCQSYAPIEEETFYFGEVKALDDGWQWQDCITGNTRMLKDKNAFDEEPSGPVSLLGSAGPSKQSPLEINTILGVENDGSCEEHATAELDNTLWRLAAWPEAEELNDSQLQFTLNKDKKTISGKWQCHEFEGDAKISKNRAEWPIISWSDSACEKKDDKFESLPASFQGQWRATIYGDTLVLSNALGEKIFFRAEYL